MLRIIVEISAGHWDYRCESFSVIYFRESTSDYYNQKGYIIVQAVHYIDYLQNGFQMCTLVGQERYMMPKSTTQCTNTPKHMHTHTHTHIHNSHSILPLILTRM